MSTIKNSLLFFSPSADRILDSESLLSSQTNSNFSYSKCHFYIYDITSNSLVTKRNILNGGTEWRNNDHIVFLEQSRNVKHEFIMNVKSEKLKTKIN